MNAVMAFVRGDLVTLSAALAGGLALHALGVPAGLLTGAMLATVALVAFRPVRDLSEPVTGSGMLLSGVLIGAAATPEALRAALSYPGSIAILLVSMVLTVLVTGGFLVRVGRWNRLDALLASAPGALSAVMAVSREKSERTGEIAVIQLFRLFLLVGAAPSLMVAAGAGTPVTGTGGPPPAWLDTAIMTAAGFAVALVFRRLGVMSPLVLGGATASVLLHAFDLVHGGLPWPLALYAFISLGAMIGTRISTVRRATVISLLPIACGAFLTSMAVALLCAWPASLAARTSFGAAFIAFAPGGLEAMALLAVVLGLDPLYVGAHHLVRFMAVGFLLPVVAALLIRSEAGGGPSKGVDVVASIDRQDSAGEIGRGS